MGMFYKTSFLNLDLRQLSMFAGNQVMSLRKYNRKTPHDTVHINL